MRELQQQKQAESRIELKQEDFQNLEKWNVPQDQIAETREAFRQRIINVQTEIDVALQAEMARQHPEQEVERPAPVAEPPVQQQAVQETRKERKERMRKRKAAAKVCPVGNENTFDMVHDLQRDMAMRKNSRNEAVIARCREAHVDPGLMLVMCQGYQTDKKGRPATPEDAQKKQQDERMIDDYLSGDQQRRKPYLDAFVKELLTTPISMDMFVPERFQRDAARLKLLGDKLSRFEVLLRENPEYFEALPQMQKDMLRALQPVHQSFLILLNGRFQLLGVNYGSGDYIWEKSVIREGEEIEQEYTPQLTEDLKQYERDSEQALQEEVERGMAKADQVLAPEYDEIKRIIEENSGPGQEYEKRAGIRFTNYGYEYQYNMIVEYREMIASHPAEYARHKAIVDQVYAEFAKAVDISADYYYKAMVISDAQGRVPLPGTPGAPLLAGKLRSAYGRRFDQNEAEKTKIEHRIIGLADLLHHYLRGKELSPLARKTQEDLLKNR